MISEDLSCINEIWMAGRFRPLGFRVFLSLLVLSREWMGMGVAGMIITSDYGSFPHSLRFAPVSTTSMFFNRQMRA